jgi:transposase
VSFDSLLSVVSWFATLAPPAALLLLGRRLWPERPINQGILVFVGTVGSSLALDARVEWVNSFLPSGTNLWPLYPRDVAVVLMVFALGVAMGGESLRRYAAVGLLAGAAVATQAQVGLVRQLRKELGTDHGTIQRVARQLGYGVESVRSCVRQADIDDGVTAGTTTVGQERIKALEQESRELRRANAILRSAAAFFAAELDRPQ